jgi:hypothetical protein
LWFQSTGSSLLWISFMPHEKWKFHRLTLNFGMITFEMPLNVLDSHCWGARLLTGDHWKWALTASPRNALSTASHLWCQKVVWGVQFNTNTSAPSEKSWPSKSVMEHLF